MFTNETPRILCVDDDRELLTTLAEYIAELLPARVTIATSVADALKMVENEGPFDLIVSDYQIPPSTGGVFFNKLRELGSEALFVFYSGYDRIQLNDFRSAPNFLGHIEKPAAKSLLKLISQALKNATR